MSGLLQANMEMLLSLIRLSSRKRWAPTWRGFVLQVRCRVLPSRTQHVRLMHAVLCAGCDYFKHIPQVTMLKVITWLREAKAAGVKGDAPLAVFFAAKLNPFVAKDRDAIATIKAANLLTVVNQFRYACCCWSLFIELIVTCDLMQAWLGGAHGNCYMESSVATRLCRQF